MVGVPTGGGLTEGKQSDGRTITSRWCCWEWIPDKFTGRLSSDKDLSGGEQLAPYTKPLLKTHILLSHTVSDSSVRFHITRIPKY